MISVLGALAILGAFAQPVRLDTSLQPLVFGSQLFGLGRAYGGGPRRQATRLPTPGRHLGPCEPPGNLRLPARWTGAARSAIKRNRSLYTAGSQLRGEERA